MKTRTIAGFVSSLLLVLALFSSDSRATGHRPESSSLALSATTDAHVSAANTDDFSFDIAYQALMDTVYGCTYPWATGYNPEATFDDGSCIQQPAEYCCPGDCVPDGYINIQDLICLLSVFDTYCDDSIIYGCTDPAACNYNPDASLDDGSCFYPDGCYDETACNFNLTPCDNELLVLPTEDCVYPDADGLCCGCTAGGIQLDFTGPEFTLVPADQNNECEEQSYSYEFSDACMDNDAISVTETRDTLSSDDCGNYNHLVTIAATDSCGNTSTVQFTIIVQDTDEPYLFLGEFPNDTTLSCTEEWPEVAITNGFDNCDGATPVFFNETVVYGECAGSYDILRTWLMQDCSGNEQTHQQVITIIDDELPFFTLAPEDQTNQCEEQPYAYEAFDNCNDVAVFESRDTLYADSCGNYEHLVTLTATDSCGNFADTTFMISVFDTEPPMWTNLEFPEVEITVGCEDVPAPWEFAAEDACQGLIDVQLIEESSSEDCPSQTTLTRTWIAADCSGNSISFVQTIYVADTDAPQFVEALPMDATVECDAVPAADTLTALDNCDTTAEVIFNEAITNGACPQTYTITRTWTANDCAGNTSEHVQTINVQDTTAPVFTEVPEDQTNQCQEQPYSSAATDNCGALTITETREVISEDACGNYEHLVTLTATDECGNSTSHSFTIVVADTEAPAFVEALPADETVECDAVPSADVLTATDNCDAVEVVFNESITDGVCPQAYTITRTWTVSDCSGNTTEHVQTIEVQDTTAPEFVDLPQDQFNQCAEQPYTIEVTDNCGSVVVEEMRDTISSDACGNYEHLVTLTATDDCGNSTIHSFTILVADTEAPSFVEALPVDQELNCSDGIPAAVTLTAVDNCDAVEVIFTEDTTSTNCVTTFTRIWTATDCTGNSSTHVQLVVVTDDVAPVFTAVPDETISLTADASCNAETTPGALGTPEVDDACSGWELSYADSDITELCEGSYSFVRVWTAIDDCGNTSEFSQNIEVLDLQPPSIDTEAEDLVIECAGAADQIALDNWLNTNGGAVASDNCSDVTWTNDFVALDGSCAGDAVVVTFTATDDCGNSTSTVATIDFVDTTAPSMDVEAMDYTVECDGAGNAADLEAWLASNGGASASDACSNVTWSNNFDALSDSCGATGTATVTFTATDACDNSSSTTATFTIEDTTAPSIEMEAMDVTVECDGSGNAADLEDWLANIGGALAGDVCSGVTWSNDFVELSDDCGATGSATVTFTATDDCGLSSSTTATFTILDTTAPEITNLPAPLVLECDGAGNAAEIEAWLANFGGAEATDICSGVTWTHDYMGLTGACGATGEAVVTFTATDECGNATAVQASVTVEDTTAPTIAVQAEDLTVECDGDGNLEDLNQWLSNWAGAAATDTCSSVTWSHDYDALEPSCGDAGFAVVTFTASDACGNSTSTTATFTIEDTAAPQFTSLPIDQNAQCEELPYQAVAFDVCGGVEVLESREVISEDACGNYEHLVTLTATDGCGNDTTHQFTIIVQDTIAPDWNEAIPADITIGCGELADAPTITATDNCDASVVVVFTEEIIGEETGCSVEYEVVRTWTATDCSGNAQTATQIITVVDESLPEWDVEIPAVAYAECDAIPDPSLVTASDNCDSNVEVIFEEIFEPGPCPNRFILNRTWTASDDCGNTIQATQVLTVVDTTAPTWISELPPASVTVASCDDIPPLPTLEAIDNCDGETAVVSYEFYSPATGCTDVCECGGVVVRTWISSDACGNLATFVQYYNVLNPE